MVKFLTGKQLNLALNRLFQEAEERLILVSPYIKLDAGLKKILDKKKDNPHLEVTVVYGKNEDDKLKSLSVDDIDFLVEFPNIEIRYLSNLHAKYYANEKSSIITSLNLHSFSIENNVEFGVMATTTFSKSITKVVTGDDFADNAEDYIYHLIPKATLVFANAPIFEEKYMGLQKKYLTSYTEVDRIDELIAGVKRNRFTRRTQPTPSKFIPGFCIRSGAKIPFNPERPFTKEAFDSWSKFKNADYPEKFCHFSGEPSNGETSFGKPIMRKNWEKAKTFG